MISFKPPNFAEKKKKRKGKRHNKAHLLCRTVKRAQLSGLWLVETLHSYRKATKELIRNACGFEM